MQFDAFFTNLARLAALQSKKNTIIFKNYRWFHLQRMQSGSEELVSISPRQNLNVVVLFCFDIFLSTLLPRGHFIKFALRATCCRSACVFLLLANRTENPLFFITQIETRQCLYNTRVYYLRMCLVDTWIFG